MRTEEGLLIPKSKEERLPALEAWLRKNTSDAIWHSPIDDFVDEYYFTLRLNPVVGRRDGHCITGSAHRGSYPAGEDNPFRQVPLLKTEAEVKQGLVDAAIHDWAQTLLGIHDLVLSALNE